MHIIVIGAGIIGAAMAYYLSRSGARVTVLAADQVRGGASDTATAGSFAWINASFNNPEPYYRLRAASMAEYRDLDQGLDGALALDWSGCLAWDMSPSELAAFVDQHGAWGYDIRLVEAGEIARIAPNLRHPPALAAFAAGDGALEPCVATATLLKASGAQITAPCRVTGFTTQGGQVNGVTSDQGTLTAEAVVLTAGNGTAALADSLGVKIQLRAVPGLLAQSAPVAPCCGPIMVAPELHLKQDRAGRLVVGRDFGGGPVPDNPEAEGAALLATVPKLLDKVPDLQLAAVTTASRPTPQDGFPIVGFVSGVAGLYIAAMHSGITLAPIVGRLAAEEIVQEKESLLLAPYRPSRFS
ncbi:MAG: FAD-binding oxidoreductase [Pseudomonadota bacterium]